MCSWIAAPFPAIPRPGRPFIEAFPSSPGKANFCANAWRQACCADRLTDGIAASADEYVHLAALRAQESSDSGQRAVRRESARRAATQADGIRAAVRAFEQALLMPSGGQDSNSYRCSNQGTWSPPRIVLPLQGNLKNQPVQRLHIATFRLRLAVNILFDLLLHVQPRLGLITSHAPDRHANL